MEDIEKLDAVCIVTDATKGGKAMEPDPEMSREKEHLLWEMAVKCSPGLSEGEQNQFYQLLLSYSDIFADTRGVMLQIQSSLVIHK